MTGNMMTEQIKIIIEYIKFQVYKINFKDNFE